MSVPLSAYAQAARRFACTHTSGGAQWGNRLPGLALTGAMALAANGLSHVNWLQSNGISALTLAIVLGMVVGNTVYPKICLLYTSRCV